jgi:hypothetical protein
VVVVHAASRGDVTRAVTDKGAYAGAESLSDGDELQKGSMS